MNRPRSETYAPGTDSKHKVIFSRANESNFSRTSTYDSIRQSHKYSDGGVGVGMGYSEMVDGDTENMSVYNTVDDSKDIINIQSGLSFQCIGDDNRWNFLYFCIGVGLSTAPVFSTLFWAPVILNHRYAGIVASIGGFSQSLMWTAHVKYLNRCAQLMLKSMHVMAVEDLNRSLASTFAFIYFISLSVVFLTCVLVLFNNFSAPQILAYFVSMYFVSVVISLYCLSRLDDMGDRGGSWADFQFRRGLLEMIIGVRLFPNDFFKKLICLIPYHVAWGCTTSFWVYYILGELVNNEQSRGFVGIVCVVDFSTSLAFSYMGNKMTKWCMSSSQTPMLVWGWLCMTTIGVLVMIRTNQELGTRRRIIGYAITHGMARAVYENNSKAVIANFFPEHETVAFSVTSFSKTLTSGITFMYYAFIVTREVYGAVVIVTSGLGVLGYMAANAINKRELADGYNSMRSSSQVSLVSEETNDSLMFVADYF